MDIHGSTYVPELDQERLGLQWKRVFWLMRDSKWRTLREIADATNDPESSVSARLRDFRKMGYTVSRRRRGDPKRGLFEYQLSLQSPATFDEKGQGAFL